MKIFHVICICLTIVSIEALAIKNGTDTGPNHDKVIFMPASGTPRIPRGTAFNVKYPRCMLTAAHIGGIQAVYAGADLRNLTGKKHQFLFQNDIRPNWASPWTDLQVLWLTNMAGADKLNEPDDYDPLALLDTFAVPETGLLYGYGHNTTQSGTDVGRGIRRWGGANTTRFVRGNQQTPARAGSYYQLDVAAFPSNSAACEGDSGGPVAPNGGTPLGVFGVISTSNGTSCSQATRTEVTGLDRSAPMGEKSNWDWVHETIEKICTKKVGASVWPLLPPSGRVVGTLTPAPLFYVEPEMNGYIDTEYGDGDENVHHHQSITLTAIPDPGMRFKQWTSLRTIVCTDKGCVIGRSHCIPCEESTDPVCELPYPVIGYYDEQESDDTTFCIAEFEAISCDKDSIDPACDAPKLH